MADISCYTFRAIPRLNEFRSQTMQKQYGEKTTVVLDGVEYPSDSTWIKDLEHELHWRLYWQQQFLMKDLIRPGDHLLEIGPGTGFTSNYLRSKCMHVTTLDFTPGMKPDIVANMLTYEFPDQYDAVMAFEVFEHVPFDKISEAMPRIVSACRRYLFFSVPKNTKTPFFLELKLPRMRARKWAWSTKRGRPMTTNHFWEVDYNGVSLADLENLVTANGLQIERRFEAFERMFFACRVV
jgi:2-polyprenyl-3-methyl-5-hydroxy-6-metoxy-1,4-benzoquinol methylase